MGGSPPKNNQEETGALANPRLERDNRGIGVDDPLGNNVVGSKRVYKIDISGATDVTDITLPLDALPLNVFAVSKSPVFIDLATDTVLPNGKIAEKWEGLAIGPRLKSGARVILAGNDNDYSVTQSGSGTQFDVYVDFNGNSVQRDLDQPTRFDGVEVGPVPDGYTLLPGVLHAYRVLASDLPDYVSPEGDDD
ncbi:MAG: esterase-like activity of phytase family protein [Gammaproteobacteria bacterium]